MMKQSLNQSLMMQKLLRIGYYSCVIFLGITFFSSGMGKLFAGHRFIGFIGPVWLEEKLAQFDLGLYARFIAYAQVSIGYMLLTVRFRTLGGVMLVPMLANILMITISQNWRGTPYVVAVLLIQNSYILWYDRAILLPLINGGQAEGTFQARRFLAGNLVWLAGLLLVMFSIYLSGVSLSAGWITAAIAVAVGSSASYAERRFFSSKSIS